MCDWDGIIVNAQSEEIVEATPQVVLLGLAMPVGGSGLDIAFTENLRGYEQEAVLPEQLIEIAGRTCYKTHDRITKESASQFVKTRILDSGHASVLEHSLAIFRITGGSRSFTHQLVRHRLMGISQESQRYCDEGSFRVIIPPSIKNNILALALYKFNLQICKAVYKKLIDILGKKYKEDARFVLPNAVESEIVISPNFRELRHIFELRCDSHAQWEIRNIALQMLGIMKQVAPTVFGDFIIDTEKGCAYQIPLTCEKAISIIRGFATKPARDRRLCCIEPDYIKALQHLTLCPNSDCKEAAEHIIFDIGRLN